MDYHLFNVFSGLYVVFKEKSYCDIIEVIDEWQLYEIDKLWRERGQEDGLYFGVLSLLNKLHFVFAFGNN